MKLRENRFKFKHFPIRITPKHLCEGKKKMLENPTNTLNMIKDPNLVLQKVNAVVQNLTKDRIIVISPNLGAYEVSNED